MTSRRMRSGLRSRTLAQALFTVRGGGHFVAITPSRRMLQDFEIFRRVVDGENEGRIVQGAASLRTGIPGSLPAAGAG